MKKTIWSMCCVLVAASAAATPGTVKNGGFETGNFHGWLLQLNGSVLRPAGGHSAAPWASVDSWLPGPIFPESGRDFAALHLGGFSKPGENSTPDEIDLSQTVWLQQGEVLSGWALLSEPEILASPGYNEKSFDKSCSPSRNLPGEESAWVAILDGSGAEVANPWEAVLKEGPKAPVCTEKTGTWEYWQWQAPTTGSYTLELGTTTGKRAPFCDEACFDGICVHSVPEPSALGFLVIGFGLFAIAGLRKL